MLNKVDSYGGSYCRAPLYLFHVFQIEFHIKQIDSIKAYLDFRHAFFCVEISFLQCSYGSAVFAMLFQQQHCPFVVNGALLLVKTER